jgi:hypothetical protein
MAEAGERAAAHVRPAGAALDGSAVRHQALERRAADQPAARYGALLNARPAGLRPAGSAGIVQRYRMEEGGKASEEDGLFLAAPRELYAGPAQFDEASHIPGDITFRAGNAHAQRNTLKRVIPEVEPGSELDHATRPPAQSAASAASAADPEEGPPPGYTPQEGLALAKRGTMRAARPAVLARLMDKLLAAAPKRSDAENMKMYGTADPGEVRELMAARAEGKADRLLDEAEEEDDPENLYASPNMDRLNAYLASQEEGIAPLMPSDCHVAARLIAGFEPDTGEETQRPAAGAVYRILPIDKEKAEWTAHYAAIIMTDDDDHVTMENAAAKESEGYQKLPFDQTWFFEMYGTREDQSFDDKYGPDMDRSAAGGE